MTSHLRLRSVLVLAASLALVAACGPAGGGSDGGTSGGATGGADGGVVDGGGGTPDGGLADAGTPDGGAIDGGTAPDGGTTGGVWAPVDVVSGGSIVAIAGSGPSDVYASAPLEHFDGSSWSAVSPAPATYGSHLWMASATDGWMVGGPGGVARLVGGTWTDQPDLVDQGDNKPLLTGVDGSGPDDVWAVGMGGAAFHFDGTAWAQVAMPTTDDLTSVLALAPDDAWVASVTGGTYHWDGTTFAAVYTPTLANGDGLLALAGSGPDDVWAAGNDGGGHGVLLRWDGRRWSQESTALLPVRADGLFVTGPADVWVGGPTTLDQGQNPQGIVIHRAGGTWDEVGVIARLASYGPAPDVDAIWGSSDQDMWFGTTDGQLLSLPAGYPTGSGTSVAIAPVTVTVAAGATVAFSATTQDPQGVTFSVDEGASGGAISATGPLAATYTAPATAGTYHVRAASAGDASLSDLATVRVVTGPVPVLEGPFSFHLLDGTSDQDLDVARQLMHFDGTSFTEPAGARASGVTGMWRASASEGWIVGHAGLMVHLHGGTWTVEPSFQTTGGATVQLSAVGGTGPSDVWAAGLSGLVFHYDGTGWTQTYQAYSGIQSILALSPTDVWAVNSPGLMHYDGIAWTKLPAPTGDNSLVLLAIVGTGPSDLWVVGQRNTNPATGYLAHYDGTSWTKVSDNTTPELYAAWVDVPGSVYLGGADLSNASAPTGVLLHYDATGWQTLLTLPAGTNPAAFQGAGPGIAAIWGTSAQDLWLGTLDGILYHLVR